MADHDQILRWIYRAIDDVNVELGPGKQLSKKPDTLLFGPRSELDSLALVSLIVACEQRIYEEAGVSLSIADDRAMSRENSPFRSVASLAQYIQNLLDEGRGDLSARAQEG
jgi:acyl carrier protein